MDRYTVLPLEWKRSANPEYPNWYTASTIFGDITIDCDDDTWHYRYCFDEYYDEGRATCDSFEDAKEKAEAFYLRRLLPALEKAGK